MLGSEGTREGRSLTLGDVTREGRSRRCVLMDKCLNARGGFGDVLGDGTGEERWRIRSRRCGFALGEVEA